MKIDWQFSSKGPDTSGTAEIVGHKVLVSRVSDDPQERWIWLHDLPASDTRRKMPLHGIELSRIAAIGAATRSLRDFFEEMARAAESFERFERWKQSVEAESERGNK